MKKIYILLFLMFFTQSLIASNDKYLLSKLVYDTIIKTQLYLDQDKYQEAKQLLLKLDTSNKVRKKLDKAYLKFYIGYIYTLKDNSTKAISYFEKALLLEALPPEQLQSSTINLVQLYMQQANYNKAIYYLDKLIVRGPIKAEYYVYKANANLALKKYSTVIENINDAIKFAKKKKTNWLQTKFYCYYVLKEYPNATKTIKELIELQPEKKDYWTQLSSLYVIQEKLPNALASLDVANILKINLNKNELLQLVSWLRYMNVPYKAATIMLAGIENQTIEYNEKNLETLGDLYYESKEFDKAIKFYLEAAKKSENGKMYFKVSQIYSKIHENKKVIDNIKLSLQKNDNKNIGEKKLLLAKSYYELGMTKEAKAIFIEVLQYPEYKKFASAWLQYLK